MQKKQANLPLPAVVLMGPPHSGKSVLAVSLSRALRRRRVPHYLFRASPDGEGNWFAEGPPEIVRDLRLRYKHEYTETFVQRMAAYIRRREVPLLIDPGGKPTPQQVAALFAQATHAILLLPEGTERRFWESILARYRLPLLADLLSRLEGESSLQPAPTPEAPLRGVLTGLVRGHEAQGPPFEALVARLADLFSRFGAAQRARHLALAPAEVVDAEAVLRRIAPERYRWLPADLQALVQRLKRGVPVALYGPSPVWVVATVALWALPAPMYVFDVRYGWLKAPEIRRGPASLPLEVQAQPQASDWLRLRFQFSLEESVVNYAPQIVLPLPEPKGRGIILDGRLPLWLWAGLARFYAPLTRALVVYHPTAGTHVRLPLPPDMLQ